VKLLTRPVLVAALKLIAFGFLVGALFASLVYFLGGGSPHGRLRLAIVFFLVPSVTCIIWVAGMLLHARKQSAAGAPTNK
jgi:hypothetical protein